MTDAPAWAETPLLITRPLPGCACLTLNRPRALNALSAELRKALAEAFRALDADDSVRVVVLTGAGKAFCAGLDLRELGDQGVPVLEGPNDPMRALEAFGKPDRPGDQRRESKSDHHRLHDEVGVDEHRPWRELARQ